MVVKQRTWGSPRPRVTAINVFTSLGSITTTSGVGPELEDVPSKTTSIFFSILEPHFQLMLEACALSVSEVPDSSSKEAGPELPEGTEVRGAPPRARFVAVDESLLLGSLQTFLFGYFSRKSSQSGFCFLSDPSLHLQLLC
ncbi:hypothetical protein BX616_004713 [Lobosporangium transversale]|nr:hypothetical protein BX616_004713 [Lobosporangium transversale]